MVIRPGVSAIILTGEGLLLQRRSDNRLWGLPGGGVEPGESVTQALVREVRGDFQNVVGLPVPELLSAMAEAAGS